MVGCSVPIDKSLRQSLHPRIMGYGEEEVKKNCKTKGPESCCEIVSRYHHDISEMGLPNNVLERYTTHIFENMEGEDFTGLHM